MIEANMESALDAICEGHKFTAADREMLRRSLRARFFPNHDRAASSKYSIGDRFVFSTDEDEQYMLVDSGTASGGEHAVGLVSCRSGQVQRQHQCKTGRDDDWVTVGKLWDITNEELGTILGTDLGYIRVRRACVHHDHTEPYTRDKWDSEHGECAYPETETGETKCR